MIQPTFAEFLSFHCKERRRDSRGEGKCERFCEIEALIPPPPPPATPLAYFLTPFVEGINHLMVKNEMAAPAPADKSLFSPSRALGEARPKARSPFA